MYHQVGFIFGYLFLSSNLAIFHSFGKIRQFRKQDFCNFLQFSSFSSYKGFMLYWFTANCIEFVWGIKKTGNVSSSWFHFLRPIFSSNLAIFHDSAKFWHIFNDPYLKNICHSNVDLYI